MNPSRLVLHAPMPFRPQPIKGTSVQLPWSSSPLTSLMMSPNANMLPFPGLAQAESLCSGPASAWHQPGAPKLNLAEQTVMFRLRSLPEHLEAPRKTLEKKEQPACWTERVGGEGPREAYEGPLDLSERGKSTSSQSPTDYSPAALQDAEPSRDSPNGHLKTKPSPQGDSSPSHSAESPEEDAAAGSKTQVSSGRRDRQQQHAVLESERPSKLM